MTSTPADDARPRELGRRGLPQRTVDSYDRVRDEGVIQLVMLTNCRGVGLMNQFREFWVAWVLPGGIL